MSRILFVMKGMGAFNVCYPVILEAKDRFHEVCVVAEGLALKKLNETRYPKYVFKGTENFETDPFECNEKAIMDRVNPDLVITGLSEPINLEERFGLEANVRGIPLVGVHDFWGCFRRSTVSCDVLCVLDEFDSKLVENDCGYEETVISGNPGAKTVEVSNELRQEIHAWRRRFGAVFCYGGGDPEQTEAELVLLFKCMRATEIGCLVARFHPKYANQKSPNGHTWGQHWEQKLQALDARYVKIKTPAPNSDAVAVASDLFLSGFSTMSTTTVFNGTPSAMLETGATLKSLFGANEIEEIPHGEMGIPVIRNTVNLLRYLMPPKAEVRAKFKPFDPKAVLESVGMLVS